MAKAMVLYVLYHIFGNLLKLNFIQYIFIHDGFHTKLWSGALAGADRWGLDLHEYFAFGGTDTSPLDEPAADGQPGGKWPLQACQTWGPFVNEGCVHPLVAGYINFDPLSIGGKVLE
jgi:glucan 1,3-beta-glucosidase